ncbi:hypothetical protein LQ564_21960 [Massilia sp. G4R7]|uniref:Uncharacterized protein n=1 Tax=Massilia phyllostachyos TaxID=2898585 RepID=A0ABS8QB42_9BURK|nr:hypothetical protein [Massilia phyllostachyos]MCD2518970.1 hypothetical protein [Massilia phyllostachyos]
MAPESPFFLLLRSRRAWYRRQSFALYLRYGHVLAVLLALTAPALIERPEVLAEPILHAWRHPGDLLGNAAWACAWLGCVFAWVRVHRPFIAGGALATYVRSLPETVRAAPLLDGAMLLVSLQIFLVPIGLAAWTIARGGGGGAGAAFAAYAAALAVLTLVVARLALRGAGRRAWTPAAAAGPGGAGFFCLVKLQCIVLARRHPHAALPRLALAGAIMATTLWLVFGAGKLAESSSFVKVGCWLAVAVMSGFHYLFWSTRQPLAPFLASLPRGTLRMALSEQLLVLGATGLLFAGAWAACLLQGAVGSPVAAQLLRHGAAGLAVLPVLGLPLIQRHQDGMLVKVAILVASFLLL